MADTSSTSPAEESGTWQTVEQAAVSLGLSVRTVNRHISAGKIRSRLTDGRREVFVPQPSDTTSSPPITPSTADAPQSPETKFDPSQAPSSPPPGAQSINESSGPSSFSQGGQTVSTFGSTIPYDVETALARADNAADKAEMAVTAYQTLARSIEAQAVSAKRNAKTAWTIVAVLTVGAGVAIGWTATKLTQAQMEAQHLQEKSDSEKEELKEQTKLATEAADNKSAELERVRDRLSEAEQKAARAEGRAATLAEQLQTKKPTTQSLLDHLTSAFTSPSPSDPH